MSGRRREARYGFHMLRHAAASLFIKHLGWSPKRLQTVMGHATISMTFDRYCSRTPKPIGPPWRRSRPPSEWHKATGMRHEHGNNNKINDQVRS